MAGNGAVGFSAANSLARTSSTSTFALTGDTVTVEFWFRGWQTNGNTFLIATTSLTTTGWGIRHDSSTRLQFTYSNGTTLVVGPVCPANTMDGAWHHWAFVKSAAGIVNYMDGGQVASSAVGAGANLVASSDPLCIGARPNSAAATTGMFSEVRVWNVARTGPEIFASYNTRLVGTPTGLLGRWPMSEDAGTSAADSVAGNNAALTATFWTVPPSPFNTGGGGGDGGTVTNNDLAAWLSASDGTHLDSAPLRADIKFTHDGITIDTKIANLATQLTLDTEGLHSELAVIRGATAPPAGSPPGTASDQTDLILKRIGPPDPSWYLDGPDLWSALGERMVQLADRNQGELYLTGDQLPDAWVDTIARINAHTDGQLGSILAQFGDLFTYLGDRFAETNSLIGATGEVINAHTTGETDRGIAAIGTALDATRDALFEDHDEQTGQLVARIGEAEGTINAHTTAETDAVVNTVNIHADANTAAILAGTVASEERLADQATANRAAINTHTTTEADRIIAALPTGGGGDGGADTAAINAHTTAQADRVIANNNAQTTILIAVQTALAAVTLTVNTILEKVQDMVDQLTNVTGMLASILAWINGQPGGGGTATQVATTAFNGTTYWPQSADYYEIEITAATGQTFMRDIPGGQHFRALGWTAQRVGGKYVFGEPLAFSSQRVNAGAILPDGLLINVKPGCTGTVTAYSYQ